MNVVHLAANQVAADGPHSDLVIVATATSDQPDIRTTRTVRGLQRVAGDRPFANRTFTNINVDFGGRQAIGVRKLLAMRFIVVVFDVIAGDLQIANLAVFDPHATEPAIADMRPRNAGLMQIDIFKVNADARIVVDVAMINQQISSSFGDVNSSPQLPKQ